MAKFLSEEWVAQARALHGEYRGKHAPPAAQARINLTITEVPADVGEGPILATVDTTGGEVAHDRARRLLRGAAGCEFQRVEEGLDQADDLKEGQTA